MKTISEMSSRYSNKSKFSNVYESTILPIFACSCSLGSGRSCISTTSAMAVCLLLILTSVYIVQRTASYRVNTTVLFKNPLNDIVRECPKPSYEVLSSSWTTTTITTTENAEKCSDTSNSKNRPRICMTTLTDSAKADPIQKLLRWRNFDSLLDMTWSNKQIYCDKHGYVLYNESMTLDSSRPPSWSKIRAVQRLLTEEKCDWVFWLDADTVIMNSDKRIEDFLPLPDSSIDLLLTTQKNKSRNAGNNTGYNAGAWLIRNTPWSLDFLKTWWNMKEYVQPKGLSVSGDNWALVDYISSMKQTYRDEHIAAPPRCLFNSVAKFVTASERAELSKLDCVKLLPFYKSEERYHKTDFVAHIVGVNNKITTTALLLEDAI